MVFWALGIRKLQRLSRLAVCSKLPLLLADAPRADTSGKCAQTLVWVCTYIYMYTYGERGICVHMHVYVYIHIHSTYVYMYMHVWFRDDIPWRVLSTPTVLSPSTSDYFGMGFRTVEAWSCRTFVPMLPK